MLSKSISLYKNLQRQYSRRINLDLNRIQKVLLKLNSPHLYLKNPINILGSDGKMSTLTSLKIILESDKKKVNTFTSPHLYDLRHRIWLKNRYIKLYEIKKDIKIIQKLKLKLTLFELLTCVYILSAIRINNIDYNLIEAGLLFKKDSTNLWPNPRAQIVTNINFQHQDWVNPKTLREICVQKLGSLSQNTTIYIAKQNRKTLKIIKDVLKKNRSRKVYSSKWKIKKVKKCFVYQDRKNSIRIRNKHIYSKGLIDNLGFSIMIALDLGISKKKIVQAIPKISFEGRVQYLKRGRLKKILYSKERLLVDGCHSTESAKNLSNYLKTLKGPVYGIWGMQKNKLPVSFIKSFKNIFKEVITVPIPNENNSYDSNELADIGSVYMPTSSSKNIILALKKISSNKNKTIVIFGSLYLVGNALAQN